jgi:hypothetical protein
MIMACTAVGCASVETSSAGAERDFSGVERRPNPSLRVGDARVIDRHFPPSMALQDTTATRVELDRGRFIVGWTRESAGAGHRALAQVFRVDGSPLGAPVVISPLDVDVVGGVTMASTSGQQATATFVVASGNAFKLVRVSVEADDSALGPDLTARR